ncbi:hypothetical protein HK100_001139, partial [Physocladia obscura]
GNCRKGARCLFLHASDPVPSLWAGSCAVFDATVETESKGKAPILNSSIEQCDHERGDDDDEDLECVVCYEKPSVFALLLGCSHVLCQPCSQQWRNRSSKEDPALADSAALKSCPVCRSASPFVVTSIVFPKTSDHKNRIIAKFRFSTQAIPCKYFKRGPADISRKMCPFGDDCLYGHFDSEGNKVLNVKKPPPAPSRRRRGENNGLDISGIEELVTQMRALGISTDELMNTFIDIAGENPHVIQQFHSMMAFINRAAGFEQPSPYDNHWYNYNHNAHLGTMFGSGSYQEENESGEYLEDYGDDVDDEEEFEGYDVSFNGFTNGGFDEFYDEAE